MGPQCSGTLSTYSVAMQIKVLQRRQVGEMGPQCYGTLSTYLVAMQIKVLQR